jgi:hypothetical protein
LSELFTSSIMRSSMSYSCNLGIGYTFAAAGYWHYAGISSVSFSYYTDREEASSYFLYFIGDYIFSG